MIRILLLLDIAGEYDRKVLRGLVRYSREHGPWSFYRLPVGLQNGGKDEEEYICDFARKWKASAIVGKIKSFQPELLPSLNIPVVLQNYRIREAGFSLLTGDYVGSGRKAARFFLSRGFHSFAFFGIEDIVWAKEREEGFRMELQEAGESLSSFLVSDYPDHNATNGSVAAWLTNLPKPLAVFACDDSHALKITEVCKQAGIRVPEDVAVLGVDNDELMCLISDPPISSIDLDVERGGYLLGQQLEKHIVENDCSPFTVTISCGDVVQRESTNLYAIQDPVVKSILSYIDDNYKSDILMEDIFSQIPLCRRSIEIRFKHAIGIPVYKYLLKRRLENFVYLLSSTDRPVADIMFESGFKDYGSAVHAFKSQYNCSPREFRASIKK